jgi:chemosensory pili system protein ChpA (sensor histidine kinase/response regulator)
VEQCFNVWLAQERPASRDLLGLAQHATEQMRGWLRSVANDPNATIDAEPMIRMSRTVREGGSFVAAGRAIPDLSAGLDPPKDDGGAETDESPALPIPEAADAELATTPAGIEPPPARVDEPGLDLIQTDEDGPQTVLPIEAEEFDVDAVDATDEADATEQGAAVDEAVLSNEANELAELVSLARIESTGPGDTGSVSSASDETRRIGQIEISHGLYSVFLNEADEAIRALGQDVGEWRYEPDRVVSPATVRRAHSLAGITATVGLHPVNAIADPLEHLMRELAGEHGHVPALTASQFDVLDRAIERMRGMLHQFAAAVYPEQAPLDAGAVHDLLSVVRAYIEHRHDQAMDAAAPPVELAIVPVPGSVPESEPAIEPIEHAPAPELESAQAASEPLAQGPAPTLPLVPGRLVPQAASALRDELDRDLLQVFVTEAHDLLPAIGIGLRSLAANPNQREVARDLMRYLHTVKGSARMAGAMRLGELVHEMETRIESAMQLISVPSVVIEDLQGQFDQALTLFDTLQPAPESEAVTPVPPEAAAEFGPAAAEPEPAETTAAAAWPLTLPEDTEAQPERRTETRVAPVTAPFIRVRADVLDRLVDHAGEVSIARSKLETEVGTLRGSLTDLTENIQRLRHQLREVEIQADAQIQARSDQLARESATFDPLEFDRFSRLQELTRMLAESVEDVAMVQSTMLKGLQLADNDLSSQSRITRELQQQLMRVRLVPFSNVSERLYRVARQTGKEVGKRVHLEIVGGTNEIDRGVLERMSGPFEHLVRNAIVHGIELPEQRQALGKPEIGALRIEVRQEGNEIIVVFADDGGGLDLAGIRQRAIELNLINEFRPISERELAELVFAPGFSTAREVTELAGRGIGMDVVRSELASFGGRVVVGTEAGRGTRFTAYLPLTLAVTQVVLANVGGRRFAIPAAMVQQVRRFKPSEVEAGLREGSLDYGPLGPIVLRPLGQLLGIEAAPALTRQTPVALLRSGEDRLAVVVDDLTSNQEVVVKNVGPQVARLTGVLGATILGSGEIVLIINPVQLIGRAPEPAPLYTPAATDGDAVSESEAASATIMVVDDSLTVRRVTQRLLERQGFQVMLAKDGVDALRQMQDTLPDVLLVDIEMPRMDGYDLTRSVRSNPATQNIPILMITSRTATKHRSLAFELGVNEYLGKPYQEDELLRLIRHHLSARASV